MPESLSHVVKLKRLIRNVVNTTNLKNVINYGFFTIKLSSYSGTYAWRPFYFVGLDRLSLSLSLLFNKFLFILEKDIALDLALLELVIEYAFIYWLAVSFI